MRSVPSSLMLVRIVLLAFFVSSAHGTVACGEPGFQNFAADGNDLRAAVSCYVLGTNCGAVGGTKAVVQAKYGDDISYWCTGLVTDFNFVFKNMTVCICLLVMSYLSLYLIAAAYVVDIQLAALLEHSKWHHHAWNVCSSIVLQSKSGLVHFKSFQHEFTVHICHCFQWRHLKLEYCKCD